MTLRFFVWNCNATLHKKVKPILALQPDIAVISDCANPDAVLRRAPDFKFTDAVWVGHSRNKGLGVFSFGEILTVASTVYDPKYGLFLPVVLLGRHNLNILAVWIRSHPSRRRAQGNGRSPRSALQYYRNFIDQESTLVVGDLNGAALGEAPHRNLNLPHISDELMKDGWVSAWRPRGNEASGPVPATASLRKKGARRSQRIDCCLIPRGWLPGLQSATVCKTHPWGKMSHHLPLVVDVVPAS
jgi:hypothetical protein